MQINYLKPCTMPLAFTFKFVASCYPLRTLIVIHFEKIELTLDSIREMGEVSLLQQLTSSRIETGIQGFQLQVFPPTFAL